MTTKPSQWLRVKSNPFVPGGEYVLVGTRKGAAPRYLVPRQFEVEADTDEARVKLTVSVDERGVTRCSRLELRPVEGADAITGETLRAIPVAGLVREATRAVAQKVQDLPGGGVRADFDTGGQFDQHYGGRRGVPVTDGHLKDVAKVYLGAVSAGAPTEAVARKFGVVRSTAARWVARARAAGYLGPALPGRPGEGKL